MSLRDDLAQVLYDTYESRTPWSKHRWPDLLHDIETRQPGDEGHAMSIEIRDDYLAQADAVIAHLGLTEEWQTSGEVINWTDATEAAAAILVERFGNRTRRRYVTPWEEVA